MKPRGQLMIEHRLIEKMLNAIQHQIPVIARQDQVDPVFIDTVVDFIKIYADRTHHGKEEDILFKDLSIKNMAPEDKQVMAELIDEHQFGRQLTSDLVEAGKAYRAGRPKALQTIVENLNALVEFYPKHILKEDKIFFPNTEKYISPKEQETMLEQFREFDGKMIHEKYASVLLSMK